MHANKTEKNVESWILDLFNSFIHFYGVIDNVDVDPLERAGSGALLLVDRLLDDLFVLTFLCKEAFGFLFSLLPLLR